MPYYPGETVLSEQLERWTATGLIDADQASRIEAAEADAATTRTAARRKRPLFAEALGYFGAVIALAAGGVAVAHFAKHAPVGAELGFTAAAAVVLITAGALLRTDAEPAFKRLRGVLWLLATASAAGFVAVLTERTLHLHVDQVVALTAAGWVACAAPLWWGNRSSLQHAALFGGAVALVGTGMNWIDPDVHAVQIGLAFWVLSAAWGIAAYRGYLVPTTAGLAVASAGSLAGALLANGPAAGQALAVGTVICLLSLGVVLHRVVLIAFGAAGTIYVVPDTANRYLPGSFVAPLAVAVVGLVLLAIALWLAKTRRRPEPPA